MSVFVYTGSGSLSESKTAHIDEMASMHAHFPSLAHRPNAYRYMDYSDEKLIKQKLMNALMSPDLSVAFMHHHGDYDTQYLSVWPKPQLRKKHVSTCCIATAPPEPRPAFRIRYGQYQTKLTKPRPVARCLDGGAGRQRFGKGRLFGKRHDQHCVV